MLRTRSVSSVFFIIIAHLFQKSKPDLKDFAACGVFCSDLPSVGKIDAPLEAGAQRQLLRMVKHRVIQNDRVKFVARLKAADLAEEAAAAQRGKVEHLIDRERSDLLIEQTPAQLGIAQCVGHHAEQIDRLAARNIGGNADVQAAVKVL